MSESEEESAFRGTGVLGNRLIVVRYFMQRKELPLQKPLTILSPKSSSINTQK